VKGRGSLWVAALLALCAGRALADEAVSLEQPTPASVADQQTSIGATFSERPEPGRITDRLKDWLKDQPAFLRDATLALLLRTYYRRLDDFDGSLSEAWAVGGALRFRTGELFDRLSFGVTGFTSLPIYAPADTSGTQLLKPNQDSYSVVGELYGKLRLGENLAATAYRHELNTPFINRNDSRMTPNTFESYDVVGSIALEDGATLGYGGGWVTKIKERNSERFVSMSEDAGADVNRGVALAGASYKGANASLGAIYYYSPDIISIGYAEAKYDHELAGGVGLLGAVQLIDQRSNRGDLLTGSGFAGNEVALKLEASLARAVATLAYSNVTNGSDLQNPWSSYPGYTTVQVENFNRAGEQALMLKASYDFARVGMPGLASYALWTHGWGVRSSVGPNYDEYDLDLQWRPTFQTLTGLWFRARLAMVNERGGTHSTLDDYRLIVNYDFAAL